ncbi:MAG: M48 family metalloprotease, partial [Anaerolineae bacterium]
MVSETIDPQRQEKAKEYARIRRLLLVVDLSLAAALLLLFIFSGASSSLKEGITGLTEDDWAIVALYFAALFTLYSFLTLPLSYYSGFVLPHRYGLSTQTLRAWLWDQVKGGLLGLVLGTLVMEVIYYLLRAFPNHWWLLTGAFILFFTVVLSNLTPILIVPLFFKLTPASDEELVERLTRLAQRAGTQVQGVFTMDLSSKTKAANAALMGLGNTRRVVLGDTLYERYTPDEIGAILAHELGHHV